MKRIVFWSALTCVIYVIELILNIKVGAFLGSKLGSAVTDHYFTEK